MTGILGDSARRSAEGNLVSMPLPELDWSNGRLAGVTVLFKWIESAAIATLGWYLSEKRSKAFWSRTLRALAVLFVGTGTVMPLIAVGTGKSSYAFWGYPILAVAAACVGLDRSYGFSSSWMRYVSTATKIERMIVGYQLNWITNWGSKKSLDDESDFADALQYLIQFADELSGLVADETNTWVEEFRGYFSRLEIESSPG